MPKPIQAGARRKLVLIDSAASLESLRVPFGNHLERLKKDRIGQWSIRINEHWRVCFRWQDGHAWEVENR